MSLKTFRKDSSLWDIAIVAILLNAFLQITTCVHAAPAADAYGLSDPALWCSIDKAAAAQDATSADQGQNHDCCKDGRHCMGQAVALEPDAVPAPLMLAATPEAVPGFRDTDASGITTSPYAGRAPPAALHA